MFHLRRVGNILLILALSVLTFSFFRPINYRAIRHFDTTQLAWYLEGTIPLGLGGCSNVECIPISTVTAFETTRTRSLNTTSIQSVVSTQTVSVTFTESVTITKSTLIKETASCQKSPAFPASNADTDVLFSLNNNHGSQTPEQETVRTMREEGIVIIFKTGAQEVDQLAIQVGTTLRYLSEQDILFFSDQQGSVGPFQINDALRNVDQDLKNQHEDFRIYRAIRKYQQNGQDILQMNEDTSKEGNGRSGWVLDKYKFIHMVEETFEMRPNAKWYVFIETDSFVFWDNLVSWLKRLDPRKPMYLGSAVVIGETTFAHGGSGYVLSNAAMNKLLGPEQPQGLAASWDAKMKGVCCGDLALGMALKEKGVEITVAHPLLNGYKPTTFTYGPDNHWCQPVVTMHHVVPHEISAIWRYERRRELLGFKNATVFADLYTHFVEPHLVPSRENWDNLSHGREFSQRIQDEASLARQKTINAKVAEEEKRNKEERLKKQAEEKEKKRLEDEDMEIEKVGEMKKKEEEEESMAEKLETSAEGPGGARPESDADADADSDLYNKPRDGKEPAPLSAEDKIEAAFAAEKEKIILELQSASDSSSNSGTQKRQISLSRRVTENPDKNPADRTTSYTEAEKHAHESFEKCGEVCEEDDKCFQWVFYENTCKLGISFRLGKYMPPGEGEEVVWKSGWKIDRIRKWTAEHACKGVAWPSIS